MRIGVIPRGYRPRWMLAIVVLLVVSVGWSTTYAAGAEATDRPQQLTVSVGSAAEINAAILDARERGVNEVGLAAGVPIPPR